MTRSSVVPSTRLQPTHYWNDFPALNKILHAPVRRTRRRNAAHSVGTQMTTYRISPIQTTGTQKHTTSEQAPSERHNCAVKEHNSDLLVSGLEKSGGRLSPPAAHSPEPQLVRRTFVWFCLGISSLGSSLPPTIYGVLHMNRILCHHYPS